MDGGEAPGWATDGRVVRRVRSDPASPVDTTRWPATVPAVEQLLCEGLDLAPGLTVLVGENGSGKSTVVEMLAEACRAQPAGRLGAGRVVPGPGQRAAAGSRLIVERGPVRPRWSYFLRADTMHSLYTYLEDHPGRHRNASTSSATARASWRSCAPG